MDDEAIIAIVFLTFTFVFVIIHTVMSNWRKVQEAKMAKKESVIDEPTQLRHEVEGLKESVASLAWAVENQAKISAEQAEVTSRLKESQDA